MFPLIPSTQEDHNQRAELKYLLEYIKNEFWMLPQSATYAPSSELNAEYGWAMWLGLGSPTRWSQVGAACAEWLTKLTRSSGCLHNIYWWTLLNCILCERSLKDLTYNLKCYLYLIIFGFMVSKTWNLWESIHCYTQELAAKDSSAKE